MAAIREIGGDLIAACDKHDSVGILDSYFPGCSFYRDSAEFYNYCRGKVDYISICTPNFLHEAHCLMALEIGADAICEKPLVMDGPAIDMLYRAMERTGRNVWPVLQLRLHMDTISLKHSLSCQLQHGVKVEYHTPRGKWYDKSWKGSPGLSGGIHQNIGIHLFDLCYYLFGEVIKSEGIYTNHIATGTISLKRAHVEWSLSIERDQEPCRLFVVDGRRIDLTGGIDNLHGAMYRFIVDGKSWGIDSARPAIQICEGMNAAW
jgi:UDP-N-acetyl-2-amino-2-deoxyglucuronate dehydrogenase